MLLKLFTIKYILQVLLQNCWGQLSKLEYVYVSSKDYVTSAIFRYSCSPSSFSMRLHDHLLLFTEIRRLLFPLRKYYHYPLNAFFSHVPPDPPLTSTYVEVFEIKIIFLCRINDHHTFFKLIFVMQKGCSQKCVLLVMGALNQYFMHTGIRWCVQFRG